MNDGFTDIVTPHLVRAPRGSVALAPGSAEQIRGALARIGDPELLERALTELVQLACTLGAKGSPEAGRTLLRVAERAAARLVATGEERRDERELRERFARFAGDRALPTVPTLSRTPAVKLSALQSERRREVWRRNLNSVPIRTLPFDTIV